MMLQKSLRGIEQHQTGSLLSEGWSSRALHASGTLGETQGMMMFLEDDDTI